jgi:ABC-type enterobactin transport system permease subunit
MIYVSRRLLITCLLLVSACVVAGIWGLRSGAVTLETSQVFAALMGDAPRSMTMVVTEWRLPRVLMALLIGAALGVSGAIFQSLMRNPLGSPDVMGFNTGAWSGVLVAMVLFGQDLTAIALSAMVGGIVTSLLVWLLAEPAADADWEWVKPGLVSWDWWNGMRLAQRHRHLSVDYYRYRRSRHAGGL